MLSWIITLLMNFLILYFLSIRLFCDPYDLIRKIQGLKCNICWCTFCSFSSVVLKLSKNSIFFPDSITIFFPKSSHFYLSSSRMRIFGWLCWIQRFSLGIWRWKIFCNLFFPRTFFKWILLHLAYLMTNFQFMLRLEVVVRCLKYRKVDCWKCDYFSRFLVVV